MEGRNDNARRRKHQEHVLTWRHTKISALRTRILQRDDVGIGGIARAMLLSRQEEMDLMHKWRGWLRRNHGAFVQLQKTRQRTWVNSRYVGRDDDKLLWEFSSDCSYHCITMRTEVIN